MKYKFIHYSLTIHCKNESVYCTLNCPNTHTKNKTVCALGQDGHPQQNKTQITTVSSLNVQSDEVIIVNDSTQQQLQQVAITQLSTSRIHRD